MEIILASSSPRRKELLKIIVPEFKIVKSDVDEALEKNLTVVEQAVNLSYMKAKSVFEKTECDRIVIGSDTIVFKSGKIYGKPSDKADAKKMIKELLEGDRVHKIVTGLTVIIEKDGVHKEYKTSDEVKVYLKSMTDEEIEKWINTGNAMDKAGAYGLQDEFCAFVERIEGNYHAAVGLPTHKVYDIIKDYIITSKP